MSHFVSADDFRNFSRAVRFEQRYIHSPKVEEFLDTVRDSAKSRIETVPKDWNHIWRAQRGSFERKIEQDDLVFDAPSAFPPSRMKPRNRTGPEGRINSKGIPIFYGATTRTTAMSEVCPWMGELVSVGQFKTLQEVRVVNCSKFHDRDPWYFVLNTRFDSNSTPIPPTQAEIDEKVWTDIDRAFSEPVSDYDESPDYVPTQILAEVFRAEGYEGIVYKSALTEDGFNLAFFNPSLLEQEHGQLFKTKKVQFEFDKTPLDQYFVKDDESIVRVEITDIRPAPKSETRAFFGKVESIGGFPMRRESD
jgi:hypothetical protein